MAIKDEYRHCFESAAAAAGFKVGDAKAEAALAENWRKTKGRMNTYVSEGMDPRAAAIRAGQDLAKEAIRNAAIARRNALMNAVKRESNLNRVISRTTDLREKPSLAQRSFAKFLKATTGIDAKDSPIFQAIHTEISALVTPTKTGGNLFSTEALMHGALRNWTAGFLNDLGKKYEHLFSSGLLDDDISRELYEMSMRDAGKPSAVGRTGSQEALHVATVMRRWIVKLRDAKNGQGADIGDYAGYILSTVHDFQKMYGRGTDADRQAWIAAMMKGLDQPRTFENTDNPEKMLNDAYDALVTGIHDSNVGAPNMDKEPAFSGPGSLAKRLSQGRVFHWKDADAWNDYRKQYGRGTLAEQWTGVLSKSARDYALLSRWGTNPQAEFENMLRRVPQHFKGKDNEAVINFSDHQKKVLQELFSQLNSPPIVKSLWARAGANVRAFSTMGHLGSVAFTHANILATKPRVLMDHGVPFLEAYRRPVQDMIALSKDESRARDIIGAGIEGAGGHLIDTGWVSDSLPGTMSKIQNKFFKLTGLTDILYRTKTGTMLAGARQMFLDKDKSFTELGPDVSHQLKAWGFTSREWDALRGQADHPDNYFKNRRGVPIGYLMPNSAERIPLPTKEEIDATPKEARGALMTEAKRTFLGLKLHSLYSYMADQSSISPNIADRRFARLTIGNDPNTLMGQISRFLAQFHQWPVAMYRHGLKGQLNGSRTDKAAIAGMLALVASTTATGFLTDDLKDITKGRLPRPLSGEDVLAAMTQGGGLGIFGDFLFGQHNRFDQGPLETAVGPVLGDAATLIEMWNSIKDGSDSAEQLKDDLIKTAGIAGGYAPFVNLFYLRSALNYLFLDSLQEIMSPGYLERSNAAMKKNQGQSYIGPSTPLVGWMAPQNHLKLPWER